MNVSIPRISVKLEDMTKVPSLQRPGNIGNRIATLIPDLLEMVKRKGMISPSFIYRVKRVEALVGAEIFLDGGLNLHAPLIVEKIPMAKELAFAVCTIGDGLEQNVNELFAKKRALEAFILNEIGNIAVSKVALKARTKIRKEAACRNLEASSSLSPGVLGFEVELQQMLCKTASADKLGVEMRTGTMMHPDKSLSFVTGLGKHMPRWTQADECRSCRARDRCHNRLTSSGEML